MNKEANWLSLQPKPRESETTGPTAARTAGDSPVTRRDLPLAPIHMGTPHICCGLPPAPPTRDLTQITSNILAVFEDGYKRQSQVSTEHWVGFSELYMVIRNPEASALASLLSGISGVHLRSLLGQP